VPLQPPPIIAKGLRTTLEAIPGKHTIDSLQKTAILGISHTIRKVLPEARAVWIAFGSQVPETNGM
jgi:hypothetical protein